MTNLIKYVLLGLCVILVIGCDTKPEAEQDGEAVSFTVRDDLLGEAFAHSSVRDFTFRYPQSMTTQKADSVEALFQGYLSGLAQDSASLSATLLAVALDTTTGKSGVLTLKHKFANSEEKSSFLLNYLVDNSRFRYASFPKEGLTLHQGVFNDENIVLFTLFFDTPSSSDNSWYSIHYIFPKSDYTVATAQQIESSIGTLLPVGK